MDGDFRKLPASDSDVGIYIGNAIGSSPANDATRQSAEQQKIQNALTAMRRDRARRVKYLPASLFADPAWDMLLELYQASLRQYRVPISSLCIASGVPATTALRWMQTLEAKGLIVRCPDPYDGRRFFMALSSLGENAVEHYFKACVADAEAAEIH
jgi:DNA-binding MarR family transcriptional regulator